MAIRTPEDIDFSTFPDSDGQPMAETFANQIQMLDLIFALQNLLSLQGRLATTAVGGNQFVYYNPLNGRDNISPDAYVAFDVPPPAPPKWQTWVQGKFPDIVWEITSSSTHKEDMGHKRALYARLGAREYYIYDPQHETDPSFAGYALRGDRLEPLPTLASGGIASSLLGAELRPLPSAGSERRPAGVWLRVIDPTTGRPIPIMDEEHRDLQATREELVEAREGLVEAREQLSEAREQLSEEARARLAAEERAARAEAALRALLADQGRNRAPTNAPDEAI